MPVELVTTDGFLHPNAELERLGLMDRKGFPESYDRKALLRFVTAVKSGVVVLPATVTVPAGSSSVTIDVSGASVTASKSTGIHAVRHGKYKAAQISVNPS